MPSSTTPAVRTAQAVRTITGSVETSVTKTPIEHYGLTWRSIEITIVYTPDYGGIPECRYSHLEIMSSHPRRPLPMTETGYKSCFLPVGTVELEGGPVALVTCWLERASQSKEWKAFEADRRQGSLF